MVEFDELRHLWQSQSQPDSALALDGRAMSDVLHRFHVRQTIINCVRAGLLVFMAIFVPIKTHMALTGILGVACILVGGVIYLWDDWRNQIGIARLDFTKPSADFVESSIQRLADMRYPFRRTFWVFILSCIAGLNFLWHPIGAGSVYKTILMHCNATVFPFVAYWLGVKIRAKRFDLECRPIMEKLLAMREASRLAAEERLA